MSAHKNQAIREELEEQADCYTYAYALQHKITDKAEIQAIKTTHYAFLVRELIKVLNG